MKRKRIFLIGSILVLSFLLVTPSISMAGAAEGFSSPITPIFPTLRMIMISDTGLDAHTLSIDRFTEVTWINDSHTNVKIKFGKGTQCKQVTSEVFTELGARLDPDKCFLISNSIPPKGTLRFRFKEFGDYHYEVDYVNTNRVDHGELKVF